MLVMTSGEVELRVVCPEADVEEDGIDDIVGFEVLKLEILDRRL